MMTHGQSGDSVSEGGASLPVEIEIIECGSEFVVRFAVGVQSFTLQTYSDNIDEAEFVEQMLRNALVKAGATVCTGKRSSAVPVEDDVERLAVQLDAVGDERTSAKGEAVSGGGVSYGEPWRACGLTRDNEHFICNAAHREQCLVYCTCVSPRVDICDTDVRDRIIQCVNACAGIPDPAAEFDKLRRGRARALATIRSLITRYDNNAYLGDAMTCKLLRAVLSEIIEAGK